MSWPRPPQAWIGVALLGLPARFEGNLAHILGFPPEQICGPEQRNGARRER